MRALLAVVSGLVVLLIVAGCASGPTETELVWCDGNYADVYATASGTFGDSSPEMQTFYEAMEQTGGDDREAFDIWRQTWPSAFEQACQIAYRNRDGA